MDDVRIVICEACGGDGCRYCDGKGELEVRVEPVTLADLEALADEEAGRGEHR
jgi:hypothetical protein